MNETSYPLDWPVGWKRALVRTRAKFVGKVGGRVQSGTDVRWESSERVTIAQGVTRVLAELRRFGVEEADIVISTNLRLRLDGLPISKQANPADPGAAVYWKKGNDTRCMAIDRYDRIADNLAAIAATLDAMRAIERHGGATILDRAFSGFKALAAPEQPFQVLGVKHDATPAQIEDAYRRLASQHHPDRGGDEQQMARINLARDAALERASA
jgi:hypothetical protein